MFVGLLQLKRDAVVGIDGQSLVLRTDDFLVSNVPDEFHFVTVRHSESRLVVGFLLFGDQSESFIRKYDAYSEEVSGKPVDRLTVDNLLSAAPSNPRVVAYTRVVPDSQVQQWKKQTNFIHASQILAIRRIENGEKIVPGSYSMEDDGIVSSKEQRTEDGKSLIYPPIPVVDSKLSIWQTKHSGTKRYLHRLSPSERTSLFVNDTSPIADRLFEDILQKYYNGQWQALMGDLQLSYSLFLYLQCFSSFEHWKDLVAMICLVNAKGMQDQSTFYRSLISVLSAQLITMEKGFLEDMDEAGNNFLLPLLKQLCQNLWESKVIEEQEWSNFQSLLMNTFPNSFVQSNYNQMNHYPLEGMDWDGGDGGDSDEDKPVIVSTEDVQASLARSSATFQEKVDIPMEIKRAYPLLVASIMPQEDILMTCARVLDEKKDVSLVREAAAYLEEVEQRN